MQPPERVQPDCHVGGSREGSRGSAVARGAGTFCSRAPPFGGRARLASVVFVFETWSGCCPKCGVGRRRVCASVAERSSFPLLERRSSQHWSRRLSSLRDGALRDL